MSGSNPGWTYDYVPTAGEWNLWWSNKQDYSPILAQLITQGGAPAFVAPAAWTPTDASGATLTFSTISAEYTVVGNLVIASARLTYPSTANTDAAIIGGLPYPIVNEGYAQAPEIAYVAGAAAVLLVPVIGSSTAAIYAIASGSAVENVTLSGKTISFQVAYPLT
jgi:hypothetical protein